MAPVTNPFSITYGGTKVGGSEVYALHGPYVLEKDYNSLRVVFDVVAVGTSHSNLQSISDTLETAFRERLTHGETLLIDINGSVWTYTQGTTLLNAVANLEKSGSPDTDMGFSRAYTCTIEADLPADDDDGLRSVLVQTSYDASRRPTVSMQGTYTATTAGNAHARYVADFDAEAALYLTFVDSSATFELTDESFDLDRNLNTTPFPHLCNFTRTYVELLADQSSSGRDDTDIRDHQVSFADISQHPGDGAPDIYRLRRVVGRYDCAIDIDQTTNLKTVFDNKIRPHIKTVFENTFTPQVFAVESSDYQLDETSKRVTASLTILYQAPGGGQVVAMVQTSRQRDLRFLDYTYVHTGGELDANVALGFATRERSTITTTTSLAGTGSSGMMPGTMTPPGTLPLGGSGGIGTAVQVGWNVIDTDSESAKVWIGDPNDTQIEAVTTTQTVTERFHESPGGGSGFPRFGGGGP